MDRYHSPAIADLAQQLLRGPKRLRLRQLLGIDFLLTLLENDHGYPFDFVCQALTGYRPKDGSVILMGEELLGDLVLLAENLSDDAGLAVESWRGAVYTVSELAARFDVSTKTIFRWRRRGLIGWKFRTQGDPRPRLLFTECSVRRFVSQNTGLVSRGSNFSQLTPDERQAIVARASELVAAGHRTVNAVAREIASGTGRAVETIRLILKHYDETHPKAGIFNRPLLDVEVDDQRLAVWEAYCDGATVEGLARRFERPVGWIYRAVTQMRARELMARAIEYVPSDEFDAPDAEERILHTEPGEPLRQALSRSERRVPEALPPYLANLFRIPLLTRAGEQTLFRRMNYLRYRAARLSAALDPEAATAQELDHIEDLIAQAEALKNDIVQANLRLVVSIAKRHLNGQHDMFELISDGNVSLMRAVDKFDYARGFKFSTYASWAVMKNFARSIPEQRRHLERYQTGWDEMLETFGSASQVEEESDHLRALRGTVGRMLAALDDREQVILRQRYGLDGGGVPQTLEQIGQRFGVSKERIRQLEARAITKLRGEFESDVQQLLGA
ncbi:MAG: sigma-70 family RNA polymerase sigma factor [Phycisphaerales bacterium]|nr:sigma-70 family RNA polymerase sigma factor [Phycisphaerales bacterium]